MSNNIVRDSQDNYQDAYNLLKKSAIDPERNDFVPMLQDIQGNILKSHGRTYSIYLFLHFGCDRAEATKKWIGNFAEQYVVSAKEQQEQSMAYKEASINPQKTPPQSLFVNFSLSFKGYVALELCAGANFGKTRQQNIDNRESNFKSHPFEEGMVNNLCKLKDKKGDWEQEYSQNKIHALISLAHSDAQSLWQETNKIIDRIEADWSKIEIIKHEIGLVRRNDKHQPVEPFGFPDGISQPLFFKTDLNRPENRDKWCPSANLRLVLNVDPFGKQFEEKVTGNKYSYGSFLVYRKLEQNVEGFNNRVRELACKLEDKETDCEPREAREQLVRAYSMGRFREDGRPVAIYSDLNSPEENGTDLNNFNYGEGDEFEDTSRWKCPFHAHIRKVNSRAISDKVYGSDYDDKPKNQRKRRIARRGTTYGLPKENHTSVISESTKENLKHYQDLSEKLADKLRVELEQNKEGLLFFCFQTDIAAQFEKLQDYANDENFGPDSGKDLGADPIAGQNNKEPNCKGNLGADSLAGQNNEKEWPVQKWPRTWGDSENPVDDFDFFGYVTPRGGEYFFTPSLSFLKSLKEE